MNTKAHHVRFWKSMVERFGSRWIENYGKEPTKAWVDLIDQYVPDVIGAAFDLLKDRSERAREHPPTHAEFEALLVKAGRAAATADKIDHVRGYWRSVIIATILRHAALLRIVSWGTTDLKLLSIASSAAHAAALRCGADLLEWVCDAERKQGQRTPGLEQRINTELWDVLKIWRRDLDPPPVLELTSDQTPKELPACSA